MIRVLGNSGAKVELVEDGKSTILRKSCPAVESDRLAIQIEKQKTFAYDGLKSPKILDQYYQNERFFVEMEYIKSFDFVTFTNISTSQEFDETVRKLVKFIDSEVDEAVESDFPHQTWSMKVEEVCGKAREKIGDRAESIKDFLMRDIPNKILAGNCHGDLTFSNVLIDDERDVFLIDFLNPPISSPYEDIAKILQDTSHFWTISQFNGACDVTSVKIRWKYMEDLLMSTISRKIELPTLKKVQVLSLFRVIPYTEKETKLSFLLDAIRKEIDFASNTSLRW